MILRVGSLGEGQALQVILLVSPGLWPLRSLSSWALHREGRQTLKNPLSSLPYLSFLFLMFFIKEYQKGFGYCRNLHFDGLRQSSTADVFSISFYKCRIIIDRSVPTWPVLQLGAGPSSHTLGGERGTVMSRKGLWFQVAHCLSSRMATRTCCS